MGSRLTSACTALAVLVTKLFVEQASRIHYQTGTGLAAARFLPGVTVYEPSEFSPVG
jgi:hypothetical protein